jgi:hypothetical protein
MASPLPRYVQALKDIEALTCGVCPPAKGETVITAVNTIATTALKRRTGRPTQVKDLSGKRFGRLVVSGLMPERHGATREALWRCRCDCGKTVSVCGTSLRRGRTKSCGCLRVEAMRRIRQPKGASVLPLIFPGGYRTPPLTEARVLETGWGTPP